MRRKIMSVRINTCPNNMLEFMCSLKMPHLFYRVDLLTNELPMNIIPSIHPIHLSQQSPHASSPSSSFSSIFILQSERKITRDESNRHHYRVYLQNLLQTHLHNVSIVCRSSHSRLTHAHTAAAAHHHMYHFSLMSATYANWISTCLSSR